MLEMRECRERRGFPEIQRKLPIDCRRFRSRFFPQLFYIQDYGGNDGYRHTTIRELSPLRAAIDTGGTFTDCVYLENGQLRVLKLFSTPADPSLAVLDALARIRLAGAIDVRHGTTLGTNAMLERSGATVAFIATAGFEDTIAIGRQTRGSLYDWFAPLPVCLVPRELRFGIAERVSAEGEILREPTDAETGGTLRRPCVPAEPKPLRSRCCSPLPTSDGAARRGCAEDARYTGIGLPSHSAGVS